MKKLFLLLFFSAWGILQGYCQANSIKAGVFLDSNLETVFNVCYERWVLDNLTLNIDIGFMPSPSIIKTNGFTGHFAVQARYYCLLNKRKKQEGVYAHLQPGAFIGSGKATTGFVPKVGIGFGFQYHLWKGLQINPEITFPEFRFFPPENTVEKANIRTRTNFAIRLGYSF